MDESGKLHSDPSMKYLVVKGILRKEVIRGDKSTFDLIRMDVRMSLGDDFAPALTVGARTCTVYNSTDFKPTIRAVADIVKESGEIRFEFATIAYNVSRNISGKKYLNVDLINIMY